MGSNSIISERALREVYLYPFFIAQRIAKPMAYMSSYVCFLSVIQCLCSLFNSYNKVNGLHVSENPLLLRDILRKEWLVFFVSPAKTALRSLIRGSDAMVMSDWFGVYSLTESINASLDLEMPGVEKWRTQDKVKRSLVAKKTTIRTIKARARKVLELVKKLCATNAEVRFPP
jgi:beta-glucosidase